MKSPMLSCRSKLDEADDREQSNPQTLSQTSKKKPLSNSCSSSCHLVLADEPNLLETRNKSPTSFGKKETKTQTRAKTRNGSFSPLFFKKNPITSKTTPKPSDGASDHLPADDSSRRTRRGRAEARSHGRQETDPPAPTKHSRRRGSNRTKSVEPLSHQSDKV